MPYGSTFSRKSGRRVPGHNALFRQIVMYHPPLYQGEIAAPVKAIEHFDNREPVDRRLGVRLQFDGARPAPALVHADIGQPTRGELADRGRAVDVIDGLELMFSATKCKRYVRIMLQAIHEDVDPIPAAPDDEVVAMLDGLPILIDAATQFEEDAEGFWWSTVNRRRKRGRKRPRNTCCTDHLL